MDSVRRTDKDEQVYPVQPIPQDAYTEFKDYLLDYMEYQKLANTPYRDSVDYWVSDPTLNKLHFRYWDIAKQWEVYSKEITSLIQQYNDKKDQYDNQINQFIRNQLKEQIEDINSKIKQMQSFENDLQNIKQNMRDQLISLIDIYNDTHDSNISKTQTDEIYQQILITKPKKFKSKYYKTLPWDPNLIETPPDFDPAKQYSYLDDQD